MLLPVLAGLGALSLMSNPPRKRRRRARRKNPSYGPLNDSRLPDESGSNDRVFGFLGKKAATPPHRSRNVASVSLQNEYGQTFTYHVVSNRTGTHWFYTVLVGKEGERSRHDAAATTSKKKADGWIAAISEAASKKSNPCRQRRRRR